jgi:hypothetical protein
LLEQEIAPFKRARAMLRSKRRMIAEDIAAALRLMGWQPVHQRPAQRRSELAK